MKAASVTVRMATDDDVDDMVAVLTQGRAAIGRLGIDQWQDGYPERRRIEDDVARGVSYVAVADDGRILGCAAIDFDGEPTYDVIDGAWLTPSTSEAPTYGVIHRIAVADNARRQGVARRLIDEALRLAEARGARSLRIDTHPGNLPMQRFIESCGFTYCGVIMIDLARESTKERLAYERIL